jgi:hypothetical protein
MVHMVIAVLVMSVEKKAVPFNGETAK